LATRMTPAQQQMVATLQALAQQSAYKESMAQQGNVPQQQARTSNSVDDFIFGSRNAYEGSDSIFGGKFVRGDINNGLMAVGLKPVPPPKNPYLD